jgi:hypothetical protein
LDDETWPPLARFIDAFESLEVGEHPRRVLSHSILVWHVKGKPNFGLEYHASAKLGQRVGDKHVVVGIDLPIPEGPDDAVLLIAIEDVSISFDIATGRGRTFFKTFEIVQGNVLIF